MTQRPLSVPVVAALLLLVAGAAALAGLGLSWVSGCCGSADPADPLPAVAGLVVGGCVLAAAIGLLTGRASRRLVLAAAGVPPVALLLMAPHSSDATNLLPFAAVGWCALWRWLRRPAPSGWLGAA